MITARSQPQLSQLLFRIIIILCRKFELLKTDPEDNVPAHQSHATGSEASVECSHPLSHHSRPETNDHSTGYSTGNSASSSYFTYWPFLWH